MEIKKVVENLKHLEKSLDEYAELNQEGKETFDLAISALEKQEQSCDTCKHGRFGDEACINCCVGFPNHYEAEKEE